MLPLGEILCGRTNRFNFNRLALFGEGSNLALPGKDDYRKFLGRYEEAALENPVLGEKDSLINIIKKKKRAGAFRRMRKPRLRSCLQLCFTSP